MSSSIKTETDEQTFWRKAKRKFNAETFLLVVLIGFPIVSCISRMVVSHPFAGNTCPFVAQNSRVYAEVMREYEADLFCETHAADLSASADMIASYFPAIPQKEEFTNAIIALYRKRFLYDGSTDLNALSNMIAESYALSIGENGPTVQDVFQLTKAPSVRDHGSIVFPFGWLQKESGLDRAGSIILFQDKMEVIIFRDFNRKIKLFSRTFKVPSQKEPVS